MENAALVGRLTGDDLARAGVCRPVRVLELRSVWGTGGGPEKTILLGAAQSDPARYSVTVCYIRDERDEVFGPAASAECLPIDYVEVREKHSFDPTIWRRLRALVRERRIDIVHAHDYKTDLLALMLARAEGTATLSTVHGWTGHSRREVFYYWADKRLLRRFPRLVAVSGDIRRELIRTGSRPDRITVILNGIDAGRFRRDRSREAQARARLALPTDVTIIGGVGRLEPQKRFDLLMEAFSQLRRSHARLLLVIAGDGSSRESLADRARALGLGESCRMLGHQADVGLVHHAIDLFVQSAKYEGTPNAVLEAMAFESPVVATDVGGTAELVRDGVDGLIVPPNDVESLRKAMDGALSAPEPTAVRVRSARARVEGELSFATRMRKLEAVYDELLLGHGPAELR